MPARKGRSAGRKRDKNARSDEAGTIGWGMDTDPEEDIFFRRALFSVLVVAVLCVCGWFLVATVLGSGSTQPPLTVNGEALQGADFWTVKLLGPFTESSLDRALLIAGRENMKQLADGCDFECLECDDGQFALCVGRFDGEDSVELREMLSRFRAFVDDGEKPFESAVVYHHVE